MSWTSERPRRAVRQLAAEKIVELELLDPPRKPAADRLVVLMAGIASVRAAEPVGMPTQSDHLLQQAEPQPAGRNLMLISAAKSILLSFRRRRSASRRACSALMPKWWNLLMGTESLDIRLFKIRFLRSFNRRRTPWRPPLPVPGLRIPCISFADFCLDEVSACRRRSRST
jgi:hypothetical protein